MMQGKWNLSLYLDPYFLLTFFIIVLKVFFMIEANSLDIFRGVFLLNAGLIILILAPAYFFTAKKRKIYLYFCNFVLTFMLVSDQLYFRYFGNPVPVYVFFQSANISGLGSSIMAIWKSSDLLYIIDLIILPFLFFYTNVEVRKNIWSFLRASLIGLVIIGAIVFNNYLDGRIFIRYSANDTLRFWGPIGYHIMDTAYYIKDINIKLTPDIEKKIHDWYADKKTPHPVSKYEGAGMGKNLIVIQLESFQNFLIGLEIGNQEITPNLNKLVKNSLYFPHYYPQTIKGNSSDAELLTNTSLYPIKEGSTFFSYFQNKYHSLPFLLKEREYYTSVIHGDEAEYWNRDKVYPNLGFDYYLSEEDMDDSECVGMGISDEAMFKQAVSFLKDLPQPFYSFVITLSSHHPFWLPEDKVNLLLPSPLSESHLGNYLRSIHYTDKALGIFIQGLEEEGLLEDSVLAIYGDHNGLWKRDIPEVESLLTNEPISEEEWIRTYLPVSLLIYSNEQQGQIIDVYGGQIDFLPTISCYMGINPAEYWFAMGNNLLVSENNYVLIPGGDYITQTTLVSKNSIETNLSDVDLETLDVADMIIRTDFFAKSKQLSGNE